MRTLAYVAFLAGLAVAVGLVFALGAGAVGDALATAGWRSLLLAPYFLPPMLLMALGWRLLIVDRPAPGLPRLYASQWVGMAVNSLLPVAQVGGEAVKARLIYKAGVPGAAAGASVVVDKTMQAVAQVILAVVGVAILATTRAGDGQPEAVLLGALGMAALIYLFYRFQRAGMFGFVARRFPGAVHRPGWLNLVGNAEALDRGIAVIYQHRRRVFGGLTLRLAGRALLAGEVWLIMYFLGYPISLLDALMIEALGQTVRAAAFFVPAGAGVQEGGLVVLATVVGAPPEIGLALSLLKRVRELLVGLPALVYWQAIEGWWFWRKRRAP